MTSSQAKWGPRPDKNGRVLVRMHGCENLLPVPIIKGMLLRFCFYKVINTQHLARAALYTLFWFCATYKLFTINYLPGYSIKLLSCSLSFFFYLLITSWKECRWWSSRQFGFFSFSLYFTKRACLGDTVSDRMNQCHCESKLSMISSIVGLSSGSLLIQRFMMSRSKLSDTADTCCSRSSGTGDSLMHISQRRMP